MVAVGWAVLVIPYLAWNYHVIGEILPSTAEAKIQQYSYLRENSIPQRYLSMGLVTVAGAQVLALFGMLVGLGLTFYKVNRSQWVFLAPAVWGFAHLTLYVIQLPIPNQNGRYVMPIIPVIFVYAVGGLGYMVMLSRPYVWARIPAISYALSVVALPIGFLWFGGQVYARQVRAINTEMVAASQWIDANVPEHDLIAVHDIGALGYFAAPRPMLDLAGLISPEMVPLMGNDAAQMAHICEVQARWLMALPGQRPVPANDPRLTLMFESSTNYYEQVASISGAVVEPIRMRVYKINCNP